MVDDYWVKEREEATKEFRRVSRETQGGGYQNFLKLSDAARRMETAMSLSHYCYGEYLKCISCGCSRGIPCISHKGSQKYANELLERIANK